MPENQEFETNLREMIARRQVVAVVGSGVSSATTRQAPTWRKLIESGVECCRTLGASERWCRNVTDRLEFESDEATADSETAQALLSAAQDVHQRLLKNGLGDFAQWL